MRFDVDTQSGGAARWHLSADDGQVIASSVASFATNAGAERAAQDFSSEAGICGYDVWDNDGSWYWDATASNGRRIVAGSDAGFVSESKATLAYEDVRDHVGDATRAWLS